MKWIGVPLAICLASASLPQVTIVRGPVSSIAEALDQYSRGEQLEALVMADRRAFGAHFKNLFTEAEKWAKTGPADGESRRRMTAVAFATNIVWESVRAHQLMGAPALVDRFNRPEDDEIFLIPWACLLLGDGAETPAAAWWYRATVAMLEAGGYWTMLDGNTEPPCCNPEYRGASVVTEYSGGGHLQQATKRLPGEIRWRLLPLHRAEQRMFRHVLGVQIEFIGATNALRHDEGAEAIVLERIRTTRDLPLREAQQRSFDSARVDIRKALAALATDPDPGIRAEVTLHEAYWRITERDWQGALGRLETIKDPALDPYVRYMAAYFEGWAHQRLNQRTAAIAAYARANDIRPRGRSLTPLLAAQLFIDGKRAEAYQLLDDLSGHGAQPGDPWMLFKLADARFIDDYVRRMREALR